MQSNSEFIKDKSSHAVYFESTGDYSLPDYNGDVRKILMITPTIIPSGKFSNTDSVEYTGNIEYRVVYLDSESNITHCSFTTEYSLKIKCNEEKYVDSVADIKIVNYGARLLGPRKFSAKATMSAAVHISERDDTRVMGDVFELYEPQVASKEIKVRSMAHVCVPASEYSERLTKIEGAIADEIDVLTYNSSVAVNSVSANEYGVELKGEVILEALVREGEEMPYLVKKAIPFDQHIDSANMSCVDKIRAVMYPTSTSYSIAVEEDGVSIVMNTSVEGDVISLDNTAVSVPLDCYMKDREVVNEYFDFTYSEIVDSLSHSESLSFELPKQSVGAENVRNVVYAVSEARAEEMSVEHNSVKVSGVIKFSAIVCEISEETATVYSTLKFDVPFVQNVKSSLHIPLIANGDVVDSASALAMLRETGADGIAIGRGAVGNPFIFSEIKCALEGGIYTPPALEERVEVALLQLRESVSEKGERVAIPEARKQIALYLRSFRGAARIRAEINRATRYEEVEAALKSALGESERGE